MDDANIKLDAVLTALNDAHNELYRIDKVSQGGVQRTQFSVYRTDLLDTSELLTRLIVIPGGTIQLNDLMLIMEYLEKIELIKMEGKKYRILYEGKILINDGGFQKKHEKSERINQREDKKYNLEIKQAEWTVGKQRVTFAMALAAFVISILTVIPKGIWKSIFG